MTILWTLLSAAWFLKNKALLDVPFFASGMSLQAREMLKDAILVQFFRESFSAKNASIYRSNNTCSVTMWELIARFMCLSFKIWQVVAGPYNWEFTQASSRPLPSTKESSALRLHRTVSNSRNMYLSWSSGFKAWSKLYNLYVQVHLKCDHWFFFRAHDVCVDMLWLLKDSEQCAVFMYRWWYQWQRTHIGLATSLISEL